MSSKLSPSSWLPLISQALLEADEIPLVTIPASLSKENLEKTLQPLLQTKELEIEFSDFRWQEGEHLLSGIGKNPKALNIAVTPLEGLIYFVASEEDLQRLVNIALNYEGASIPNEIEEAFYDFFVAKVIHDFESLGVFKDLSLRILKERNHPKELALCSNVTLHTEKGNITLRLFLSKDFRKSWQKHQGLLKQRISHIPPHIPLSLSACIGKIHLSLQEWKEIKKGDFIIVSPLGYDLENKKGTLFLSYKNTVLFHGGLNVDKIKITDNSPQPGEVPSMTKEPKENEEPDSSFFEGVDEEFFLEDEELAKVLKEELSPEAQKSGEVAAVSEKKPASRKKALAAADIPLSVKVEIASVNLTAKELLDLQPGNELSLGKEIDNSVNLLVGGRCIAKGELMRIGDVLGVRILSL